MRRNSSTWRSRTPLLLALALTAGDAAAVCLPPFVGEGLRLHAPRGEVRLNWLPLLLRQHELCWRSSKGNEDELRVLFAGNSGAFGLRIPAERTAAAELSRRFATGTPLAHFFNVAHPYAYQLKDALILRAALDYDPDFIVYGVNLSDFYHKPTTYPALVDFLGVNRRALERFADERPAGLVELLEIYRAHFAERGPRSTAFVELRQAGLFVRESVRYRAERLRQSWFRIPPPPLPRFTKRTPYDCQPILERFREHFQDWQGWNILAYLEQIRRETGIGVLIVNWPAAHDPRDACYNARYPAAALAEYDVWLEAETRRRDLPYVDLQKVLPRPDIFDTTHLTVGGHRKIADRLEPILRDALGAR